MNAVAEGPGEAIADALLTLQRLAPTGYAVGLHYRHQTSLYLFQTYPETWTEIYSRESLILSDPTAAWGFSQSGRIAWSELAARGGAAFFVRPAALGLRFGLSVSVHRSGTKTVATLSRDDRELTPDEADQAEAAVQALHDATHPEADLDDHQREVLRRLSWAFTAQGRD